MANSQVTGSIAFGTVATTTTAKALNSTSRFVFDAYSINADTVSIGLQVTLDNQGTPASGDWVDLQVAFSTDNGATYDTDEHARYLPRMDTFGSNDPGEDPCTRTFDIPASGKTHFKLIARANQGGTRTINLVGRVTEHRMA